MSRSQLDGEDSKHLTILTQAFQNSSVPTALYQNDFTLLYTNDIATERYPVLQESEGLFAYLPGLTPETLQQKLKEQSFYRFSLSGLPFSGTTLEFSKYEWEKGGLIWAVRFLQENQASFSSSEQVQTMISTFSSQLRSPLSIIFSILGPLYRSLEDVQDYTGIEYLNHISKNCYKMLRTTSNITELTRYANGIAELELTYGDLSAFTQELCDASALLIRSYGIPLHCKVEAGIFTTFDSKKLTLVLLNLILNSCLYTRDFNEITVTLERREEDVLFTVADKGAGIPAQYLSEVFEPYFSYHPDESASTGIGLTLVKYIITQHGGTVALSSTEFEGTKLAFTLPLRGDNGHDYFQSSTTDYLLDRFSPLYVNLADICDLPRP